jgi:hypothetical protein
MLLNNTSFLHAKNKHSTPPFFMPGNIRNYGSISLYQCIFFWFYYEYDENKVMTMFILIAY